MKNLLVSSGKKRLLLDDCEGHQFIDLFGPKFGIRISLEDLFILWGIDLCIYLVLFFLINKIKKKTF